MATKKIQIIDKLVTVDETLTQSGVPADAAAVGAAFDERTVIAVDENTDGNIEFRSFLPEQDYLQLDKTLTVEGAAADAKAVGDALANRPELDENGGLSLSGNLTTNGSINTSGANVHINNAIPTLALYDSDGKAVGQIFGNSAALYLRVFHENGSNYTNYAFAPPTEETNSSLVVQAVQTKQINLASYTYTWTKSGSGLYYAFVTTMDDIGLTGKTVIGLYCSGWNGHTADSLLMPYVQGGQIGVMATASVTPSNYYLTISYM